MANPRKMRPEMAVKHHDVREYQGHRVVRKMIYGIPQNDPTMTISMGGMMNRKN
jgi:hypothetical protein